MADQDDPKTVILDETEAPATAALAEAQPDAESTLDEEPAKREINIYSHATHEDQNAAQIYLDGGQGTGSLDGTLGATREPLEQTKEREKEQTSSILRSALQSALDDLRHQASILRREIGELTGEIAVIQLQLDEEVANFKEAKSDAADSDAKQAQAEEALEQENVITVPLEIDGRSSQSGVYQSDGQYYVEINGEPQYITDPELLDSIKAQIQHGGQFANDCQDLCDAQEEARQDSCEAHEEVKEIGEEIKGLHDKLKKTNIALDEAKSELKNIEAQMDELEALKSNPKTSDPEIQEALDNLKERQSRHEETITTHSAQKKALENVLNSDEIQKAEAALAHEHQNGEGSHIEDEVLHDESFWDSIKEMTSETYDLISENELTLTNLGNQIAGLADKFSALPAIQVVGDTIKHCFDGACKKIGDFFAQSEEKAETEGNLDAPAPAPEFDAERATLEAAVMAQVEGGVINAETLDTLLLDASPEMQEKIIATLDERQIAINDPHNQHQHSPIENFNTMPSEAAREGSMIAGSFNGAAQDAPQPDMEPQNTPAPTMTATV